MKKNIIAIFFLFFLFLTPGTTFAASGACSSHNGVNCLMGRQENGTVHCNDGWTDSAVSYDFTVMCQQSKSPDQMIREEYYRSQRGIVATFQNVTTMSDYNNCMSTMYQNSRYVDRMDSCISYQNSINTRKLNTTSCPDNSSVWSYDSRMCICDEGYYNYSKTAYEQQGFCEKGNPPIRLDQALEQGKINLSKNNITAQKTISVPNPTTPSVVPVSVKEDVPINQPKETPFIYKNTSAASTSVRNAIITDTADLRKCPSSSCESRGSYSKDTTFSINQLYNDTKLWYRGETPDGNDGWIDSTVLSVLPTQVKQSSVISPISTSGTDVSSESNPGLWHRIIGWFKFW